MDAFNILLVFVFVFGSKAAVIPSPAENNPVLNQAEGNPVSNPVVNPAENTEVSSPADNNPVPNPAEGNPVSNPVVNPAENTEIASPADNNPVPNPGDGSPVSSPADKGPASDIVHPRVIVQVEMRANDMNENVPTTNDAVKNAVPKPPSMNPEILQTATVGSKKPESKPAVSKASNKKPEISPASSKTQIETIAAGTPKAKDPKHVAMVSKTSIMKPETSPDIPTTQVDNIGPTEPEAMESKPMNTVPIVPKMKPETSPAASMTQLDTIGSTEPEAMESKPMNTVPIVPKMKPETSPATSMTQVDTIGSTQQTTTESKPMNAVPKRTNMKPETLPPLASMTQIDTVGATEPEAMETKPIDAVPKVPNMKPELSPDSASSVTGSVSTSQVVDTAHNSPSPSDSNAATGPSIKLNNEHGSLEKGTRVNTLASEQKPIASASEQKPIVSDNSGSKLPQSAVNVNRSPNTEIVEAKTENMLAVRESVIVPQSPPPLQKSSTTTAQREVKASAKKAPASPAPTKRVNRRNERILAKLSKQSMDRLKKLILSKSLKSTTVRTLALETYVRKAEEAGQTSESIYGVTRLEQFQMDKLGKVDMESVKKLIFRESKSSERMRNIALKVYLKMNLPSKTASTPSNVKIGDNVAPWSHFTVFPMQTHAKPISFDPQPVEKSTIKKEADVKPSTSGSSTGAVKTGDNVAPWSQENADSKFPMQTHAKPISFDPQPVAKSTIKKEADVKPSTSGSSTGAVKTGDNVAPWSQENADSKFPMQTHAKPVPPIAFDPQPVAKSTINKDADVKPSTSGRSTGAVKTGDNVAPWSQENADSKFPMQTHAKPISFDPQPVAKSTIKKEADVKLSTSGRSTGTVKVGGNVAAWSQENADSNSPMQTHAKPYLATLHSAMSATKNNPEVQPSGITNRQAPNTIVANSPVTEGNTLEIAPDVPFSAPTDQQQFPTKGVDASATLDQSLPVESSPFVQTSQVVSIGDHVHQKSRGVITDKDISAVVSSFFHVPEPNTLGKVQPIVATSTVEKGPELKSSRQQKSDITKDVGGHHDLLGEQMPTASVISGQRSNYLIGIPDWSSQLPQQVLQFNTANIDSAQNGHVVMKNPAVPTIQDMIAERDVARYDGKQIGQIPEKKTNLFSQASLPIFNKASRHSRLTKNPVIEQTSGIIRVIKRGLMHRVMSPWRAGNVRRPISETPRNTPLQHRGAHENVQDLALSFPSAQIMPAHHGDLSNVYDMPFPPESAAFMKTPSVVSARSHDHKKTASSALISDKELARIVSSFFF